MIEYNKFQLGVDYGPLSQSIQAFGNTLMQKKALDQANQIAAYKAQQDADLAMRQKQYAKQFSNTGLFVKDENDVIFAVGSVGDAVNGTTETTYTAVNELGATPFGKLNPYQPTVAKIEAETGPKANLAGQVAGSETKSRLTAEEEAAAKFAENERERKAKEAAAISGASKKAELDVQAEMNEILETGKGSGSIINAGIMKSYNDSKTLAEKKLAQIPNIEKALANADTGNWAEIKSNESAWIPGAENEAAAIQNLNSMLTAMAGAQIQLNTGVQTDRDFLTALKSSVEAGNTKEAKKMIVDRIRSESEYDVCKFNELNDAYDKGVKPRNFNPTSFEEWKSESDVKALESKHGF